MTAAHRRISERVSAITESATLAVDAKAKALKAAGRPVSGFGAGEQDCPPPAYIVAAAARPCAEPVRTDERSGYCVTFGGLEAACTPRTRALLFVSPANPTGAVYPPDRVAEIGRWAAGRGLWVITDEIYEHLVYGTARFVSMPVVVPELADRCVVLNGVAKTYAMTGWRVGWMIGPADIVKAATNLQSHATSNVCNVAQAAALAAVTGDLSAVEAMRRAFDRRRLAMTSMLNEIPGVICPLP